MTQKQLKGLAVIFWSAVGVTVIGLGGSIISRILEKKSSSRTESQSHLPIPVPAEAPRDP